MSLTLNSKHPSARETLQNVIGDLAMGEIRTSESTDRDSSTRPETRLIAPDGSIAKEWQEFVGPAEIGLAVRSSLGEPLFSQMQSDVQ